MSEIEDDGFRGLGVEVTLINDNFLCVLETLTRIGVASRDRKKLFQSCHILHKSGKYRIMHFKELFILDGKTSTLALDDILRRNTIVHLLEQWGLVKITNPKQCQDTTEMKFIKVIPYKDKVSWNLEPKYTIGINRRI